MVWWKRRTDGEVIARVLAGRRDEFGALVKRYLPMAHAVAYAQLGNHADAEDVAQEAFIKAYRALDSLRDRARFPQWLKSIVRNLAATFQTTEARRAARADKVRGTEMIEPDMAQRELHDLLRSKLFELDEEHQEVLLLHYFASMKVREMADSLHITSAAAAKRLQRARETLGKRLVDQLGPSFRPKKPSKKHVARILGAVVAVPVSWQPAASTAGAAIAGKGLLTSGALLMSTKKIAAVAAVVLVVFAGWRVLPKAIPSLRGMDRQEETPPAQEENTVSDARESADVAPQTEEAVATAPEAVLATSDSLDEPPVVAEERHPGLSISGWVHDDDGNAVEGAAVTAQKAGGGMAGAGASSDAEGRFLLSGLSEGAYSVGALKPGEGFGYVAGVKAGADNVVIALVPTSGISGRVYDQETGQGIEDAIIEVYSFNEALAREGLPLLQHLQGQQTRADGSYRVELPAPGLYALRVHQLRGYIAPDWQRADLEEGEDRTGVDFALARGGTIAGTVFDPEGQPLAGAKLELILQLADSGAPRATATSDAEGAYVFGVRPGGTYVVRAAHRDYAMGESSPVVMGADKDIDGVDVYMAYGHVVHGYVMNSAGSGIAGLEVELIDKGGHLWTPLPLLSAVTEPDGAFAIANVPAGEYKPVVKTAGIFTKVIGTPFTMPADSDLYDVIIMIGTQVEGFISGRLTGSDGAPIFGAEVAASSGSVVGWSKTGADGSYLIEGLGGAELLDIEAKGWAAGYGRDRRQGVPVNSENVDFVLARQGAVKGRVVDGTTGRPITAFEAQWDSWGWEKFNSPTGEFELNKIERQRVTVQARAEGYGVGKTDEIDIPPAKTVEGIVIALYRGNEVTGIVFDAGTGQPIEGARIKTFDGELRSEYLSREYAWGAQDPFTDAEGRFRLTGLAPKTPVNLVAWHAGYAPAVRMDFLAAPGAEATFLLGRGGTISGVVYDGTQLVGGAAVVCFRQDLGAAPSDTFSYHAFGPASGSGEFEIANLPPGPYALLCFQTFDASAGPAWIDRILVEEGETVEIDIQLADCGVISGAASGAAPGAPVEVAVFSADWPDEPYYMDRCDADGRFRIPGLQAGEYMIRAVQGRRQAEQTVILNPGDDLNIALQLP